MSTGEAARVLVEVCIEGVAGVAAAHAGGADRVELCCALSEGGLTPSHATLAAAVELALLPVICLVRPRGGDFLYSAGEFALLERDVEHARELGAAGVALGVLGRRGELDEPRMARLVERARPLPVTCHRAFDQVREPRAGLARLISAGVARVLTSGGAASAREGAPRLRELVELAAGRIEVVAAGSVRAPHAAELVRATGVRAVHLAARVRRASAMEFHNPLARLGAPGGEELACHETDPELVRALVAALRGPPGAPPP